MFCKIFLSLRIKMLMKLERIPFVDLGLSPQSLASTWSADIKVYLFSSNISQHVHFIIIIPWMLLKHKICQKQDVTRILYSWNSFLSCICCRTSERSPYTKWILFYYCTPSLFWTGGIYYGIWSMLYFIYAKKCLLPNVTGWIHGCDYIWK